MTNLKLRFAALAFVLLSFLALDRSNAAGPIGGGGTTACPRKSYSGACIQVITYATNPETGQCCVYPNPCVVPDGWTKSYTGCAS